MTPILASTAAVFVVGTLSTSGGPAGVGPAGVNALRMNNNNTSPSDEDYDEDAENQNYQNMNLKKLVQNTSVKNHQNGTKQSVQDVNMEDSENNNMMESMDVKGSVNVNEDDTKVFKMDDLMDGLEENGDGRKILQIVQGILPDHAMITEEAEKKILPQQKMEEQKVLPQQKSLPQQQSPQQIVEKNSEENSEENTEEEKLPFGSNNNSNHVDSDFNLESQFNFIHKLIETPQPYAFGSKPFDKLSEDGKDHALDQLVLPPAPAFMEGEEMYTSPQKLQNRLKSILNVKDGDQRQRQRDILAAPPRTPATFPVDGSVFAEALLQYGLLEHRQYLEIFGKVDMGQDEKKSLGRCATGFSQIQLDFLKWLARDFGAELEEEEARKMRQNLEMLENQKILIEGGQVNEGLVENAVQKMQIEADQLKSSIQPLLRKWKMQKKKLEMLKKLQDRKLQQFQAMLEKSKGGESDGKTSEGDNWEFAGWWTEEEYDLKWYSSFGEEEDEEDDELLDYDSEDEDEKNSEEEAKRIAEIALTGGDRQEQDGLGGLDGVDPKIRNSLKRIEKREERTLRRISYPVEKRMDVEKTLKGVALESMKVAVGSMKGGLNETSGLSVEKKYPIERRVDVE